MRGSTLGSCIRSLRKQNNMTQAQLADQLGVTDKAVSKWERDLSCPDIMLFPKLADALGVTVNDLLRECRTLDGHPSRLLQIFGMSHDIRTPLHIILGCVNMARIHEKESARVDRYLETIRISGEYLLRSIDRLMDIASQDQIDEADPGRPGSVEELGKYLNERESARRNALQSCDLTGRRILVVEDISVNQEIMSEILKQAGAQTEVAENGQMCVDMVKSAPAGHFDLILMDLLMPVMDGLEAARKIRHLPDPAKAAIPIIAVSANVYAGDRDAARAAGMNAFVEKPIFTDKLLAAITDTLN